MKIAFDFDGTLEFLELQELARELKERGHDVQIVTTRYDEENKCKYPFYKNMKQKQRDELHNDLYEVAKKLNIPYNFTNYVLKAQFLIDNNFDILIDDNSEEGDLLNSLSNKIKFYDCYYSFDKMKNELLTLNITDKNNEEQTN
ncbi:MAG: hypothetical protein M0P71_18675 [Melioribacteraceae bacterium]|jgi:glycogen synthase|nr:hypothetical protein [Melioribacteraceae bacterium]